MSKNPTINKHKLLLEVSALILKIEGKTVLDTLSFELAENEILALVGESGSGKSLTALSLMGLVPKKAKLQAERLLFKQKELLELDQKAWQQIRGNSIGMVFQEPQSSLNPSMRCGKQLVEVLKQHTQESKKSQTEKVLKALTEVQLQDPQRIFKSYPHELSGGQKQRVMIAMALLCEPQLLIADEPTTALDVTVQKEIIELLKGLQKRRKMSILFISHDLTLVRRLADRVCVMYNGQIIENNTTELLFTKPKEAYTKGLLNARPSTQSRIFPLPTLKDYQMGGFKGQQQTAKERQLHHTKLYQLKPLLEVKGLEKKYYGQSTLFKKKEGFQAVAPLIFSLYPGETLGLVGESGCGKSTLARALIYLDPPTAGEVYFRGKKIVLTDRQLMREIRQKIQFIFQDSYASLHPLKRIGQAIEEVLVYYSDSKNKSASKANALKLLAQVGLSASFFDRYPHELSGGQRQRIVIARALATNPELLICDESVAALDISIQAQVLNLLNELKNKLGLSYLFISHDLAVVKYMSDRVMVMKEGALIEAQEADLLYRTPQNSYTKKLIAAIPN
ncbi:MAG: dipeptide ABC transporter ATP-binding protein [Flavobacteriaceae bacterium]